MPAVNSALQRGRNCLERERREHTLAHAHIPANAATEERGHLERIQLVPVRANGQPSLAAYADEQGDGVFDAYGVMVIAINGECIAGITGFARQPVLHPPRTADPARHAENDEGLNNRL